MYPSDYLRDTRALSLAAKGGWVDVLCMLHGSSIRGTLTLPLVGWARLMSASVDQAEAVIAELDGMKIAEVTRSTHGDVTISCRRMLREHITREQTRLRVERFRKKANAPNGNAPETRQKSEVRSQKPERRARGGLPDSLNTPAFSERWLRWQTHWSDTFNHGGPMPETTAHQQLRDLAEIGESRSIAAINNAIAKGNLRVPAEPYQNRDRPETIVKTI